MRPLSPASLDFDIAEWSSESESASARAFAAACLGDWNHAVALLCEAVSEAEACGNATMLSRALVNRATAHIGVSTRSSLLKALEDAQSAEAAGAQGLLLARARARRGIASVSLGLNDAARDALRSAIDVACSVGGADLADAASFDPAAVLNAAAAGYASDEGFRVEAARILVCAETALADLDRAESLGGEALAVDEASEGDEFESLLSWLDPSSSKSEPPLRAPRGRSRSRSEDAQRDGAPPDGDPSISAFPFITLRRYNGSHRGVHARCNVPAETEVLSVGEDFCITVERAKQHPLVAALAAAGIDGELSATKHCYLALFLLGSRADGPASPFAHYIAALPSRFPGTPLFWDADELAWLQGSCVRDQVADRWRNIRNDYHLISSCVDGFEDAHSEEDFAIARVAVSSRNFGIVVDGVRTDALVPLADMLNHQRPRQTRWLFDSAQRAFRIISLVPIAAGQQIFDSYGKKCNSRFLLNYGFTVDHNADDDTGQCHNETRLIVPLRDPKEDPWHLERVERLGGAIT
jgi:hypothetical protein